MVSSVEAIQPLARSARVLLVEDSIADVHLVKESIRECSSKIDLTVAQDGEIALQVLTSASLHPNLVILDLNLPKIDGFGVLERYRPRTVPIVVFSSTGDPSDIQKVLKLGAVEFVQKPSEAVAFMSAVQMMIGNFCT